METTQHTLTREDACDVAIACHREVVQTHVGDAMERDIQIVGPEDTLETVLGRLDTRQCSTVPVVDGGRLAGLVTADGVAEFLNVQAALGRAPA